MTQSGRSTIQQKLTIRSEKLVIAIRFVAGPILLLGGLIASEYVLEKYFVPLSIDAYHAGTQPQIDFIMMLSGVAPLALAWVGYRLIRWENLAAEDAD